MVTGNGRRSQLAAVAEPPLILDPEIDEELEELEAISLGLEEHTLSANTRRAYEKAWRSFKWFCGSHSLEALPAHPEAVRWYVAWMSSRPTNGVCPVSRRRPSDSIWRESRIVM